MILLLVFCSLGGGWDGGVICLFVLIFIALAKFYGSALYSFLSFKS